MPAIGGTLLLGAPGTEFSKTKQEKTTKVVLIRDKGVLDKGGIPRYDVVQRMMDQALMPYRLR